MNSAFGRIIYFINTYIGAKIHFFTHFVIHLIILQM